MVSVILSTLLSCCTHWLLSLYKTIVLDTPNRNYCYEKCDKQSRSSSVSTVRELLKAFIHVFQLNMNCGHIGNFFEQDVIVEIVHAQDTNFPRIIIQIKQILHIKYLVNEYLSQLQIQAILA